MTIEAFLVELVGAAIYSAICWGIQRLLKKRLLRTKGRQRITFVVHLVVWVVANLVVSTFFPETTQLFILGTTILLGVILWREFDSFWSNGIVYVDPAVAAGTDYKTSLNLCLNRLEFINCRGILHYCVCHIVRGRAAALSVYS